MFIGNPHIKEYFGKLIKSDALSHAYLFHGPEGVGKKLFALELSGLIVGPYAASDLKVIDKKNEEIHIADIRELKDFINLTPFGKQKVVIINNSHNLGRDASNALLKVLEEPPGKSVIFLISHFQKMLLPTLTSRCQAWRFRPFKKNEILDYLNRDPEGVPPRAGPYGAREKINKERAYLIAKMAGGSLGLAVKLSDNFNNFQKNANLLNKLARADYKERFDTVKKISADSDELKKTVEDWFVYSASLSSKRVAREILYLNNILSKSQFNHRLALENFLAKL